MTIFDLELPCIAGIYLILQQFFLLFIYKNDFSKIG